MPLPSLVSGFPLLIASPLPVSYSLGLSLCKGTPKSLISRDELAGQKSVCSQRSG